MLVDITQSDYIALMRKRNVEETTLSDEALGKIYNIENETEGEKKYALDAISIKMTYTEYPNIKATLDDMRCDSIRDLERSHTVYELTDSVLVTTF